MLPAGQLFAAAVELALLTSDWSPAGGLFTVAVKVTLTTAPTARSPRQVRLGEV